MPPLPLPCTAPRRPNTPRRRPLGHLAAIAALLLALSLPCAPAAAQTVPPDAAAFQGRTIRDLALLRQTADVDAGGDPTQAPPLEGELRQIAENNIRSLPGTPYDAEAVLADVSRLDRLAVFRTVASYTQLLEDGTIRLVFVLEPQRTIQDVQVTGNRRIGDAQIAGVIDLLRGAPVDRFQIDRAARRIEDLYRERAYYLADVTIDEEELERSSVVLFRVREGERVRIRDIRFEAFEGGLSFSQGRLRREIETRVAGLFRKGAIEDAELDRDVAAVVQFYRDRGYLDVRADRLLRFSPDGKEAIVTFLIEEGPRYTFRDIRVEHAGEGDPVLDRAQILGLMTLKPGEVFAVAELQASVRAISQALGRLGYADARVNPRELRDTDEPLVDLLLVLDPGRKYLAGEVIIQGNTLTKQNVIRRQVEVRPGRTLDTTGVEATQRRLRQLRLFDPQGVRITLQQPTDLTDDPDVPSYRDVLIEVEETNTGEFALGGAVSSDAGFIGRIALTQRNFDIADTPDSVGEFVSGRAFRGAGQTFSIDALPGDEVETYSISLSEPYIFETDYSGTAQLFFRERDFDEFDERRFGGRFALGRRFGTRWQGSLNLRAESVEISGFPASNPTDFFLFPDENIVLGIGPRFSRTTLDRLFLPTRGSRTEFSVEQLIGDFEFTRFEAEHTVFIPIREDFINRKTVLSLSTRVGYIPQDEDEVPIFERFYLGGQSFRGLEFRTVSPRGVSFDTGLPADEPVGGTWLFFAGAEIRQPIVEETLSVVGFIDTGTVTFEPGFEDYRVTVGVGVRISIPQLSPAPLAFDFGFPVVSEETDEERLFTFTIDVPF